MNTLRGRGSRAAGALGRRDPRLSDAGLEGADGKPFRFYPRCCPTGLDFFPRNHGLCDDTGLSDEVEPGPSSSLMTLGRPYIATTRSTKKNHRNGGLLQPKSTNGWTDGLHMYIDGTHQRQGIDWNTSRLLRARGCAHLHGALPRGTW